MTRPCDLPDPVPMVQLTVWVPTESRTEILQITGQKRIDWWKTQFDRAREAAGGFGDFVLSRDGDTYLIRKLGG